MTKVLLDYGHGGNDPGAVSNGLNEKDINIQIGRKVAHHLKRHKIEVLETRTGDTNPSLTERTNMANNNNVNAVVSIHCNSFSDVRAYGYETYCYYNAPNGRKLATSIHNSVLDHGIARTDRGIKTANLHMVREPNMASALLEMGFISNTEDRSLLVNKQEVFAVAIAKGILNYFNISYVSSTLDNPDIIYKVQVGAFKNYDNAVKKQKDLLVHGIESFITS